MKHNILEWLKGKLVTVDHPITVLNPDKVFEIVEARIDNNHIAIRGENTCWFGESLVTFVE